MLLLSSATRILATERPPAILHLCTPRLPLRGTTKSLSSLYWSIRCGTRQSERVGCVSEVNTPDLASQFPSGPNKQGVRQIPAPLFLIFLRGVTFFTNLPRNDFP